ncbi:hypothetical protein SPRG_16047 [Saprolegnia parasitica CBS 223.65]|uniref:Uncharacterized protein n=1 Tax=Saprolegnia parasitica (strain CBS 223.65) TaxID=695850 RepID=A0A067BKA4_SAPPC|nr:hypothetical protein SPRG_16047 [Saprolegnia parasitica CBS 223.65]KDO18618.1 hypothetical protein SPRG_16047 [Saprolegnia parasitica CBS 223.65]|eukprot:XP_012210664.1 hypothetical protein SPRG_16047 [Saprolegnia parasitica CBS 223.65]
MVISNAKMATYDFLAELRGGAFYPASSIEKGRTLLRELCAAIEDAKPLTLDGLERLTHATTAGFNALEDELNEQGSMIDTVARECIANDIGVIAEAYGFLQFDIESLIANREW